MTAPAAGGADATADTRVPGVDRMLRLTWPKFALVVISGAMLFAAFPPVDLGPVAWFALIPLFFALTQVRPAGGLVLGIVFGFTFIGLFALYMLDYGFMAWFGSVGFQSLFFGLFGLIAAMCNRSAHPGLRALAVAGAWTLVEMLRGGIGGLGFTVGNLGYTQYDRLPLIQAASMIGHFGIGLLIAFVNSAMAQVVLAVAPGVFVRPRVNPRWFASMAAKAALGSYVVALLVFIWGALVMRFGEETGGEPIQVAAVQASLSDLEGTSVERADERIGTYAALTRAIPDDVQIVVWPETAIPVALNIDEEYSAQIADLAVEKSTWIITGGYKVVGGEVYNTLFVFSPDGEMTDTYSKHILVPFGENVPWSDRFPWLRKFALRSVDFSPGEGPKVLQSGDHTAGPVICFEALFPHALQARTTLGADLIVIATSDAWADGSFEIEQHSVTAPLRAVESRRGVIRAASWGRSQIIAPDGEVLADVPIGEAGVAFHEIRPRTELSTYHRWGDLPVQILCGVLLWFGLLGLPRRPSGEAAIEAAGEAEETGND